MTEDVKVWEEDVILPTYAIGKAEKKSYVSGKTCVSGK